ncbi:hypothetical protein BaRGS_00028327 [Batillaria attramentaria]|uniref:G-protein coupled receptors family 1 profile domain-containing protein n=1 Tax=Batillaria attramentaria TaxID=370345 RepID=A0ABD0JZR6_9CAEN
MYIASLAVSDILVSFSELFSIPWQHPSYHQYFVNNWSLSFFFKCFVYLTEASSVVAVSLFGVDRFICIDHPFFYVRTITQTKVLVVISVSWIYSIAFAVCVRLFRFEPKYPGCDAYAIMYDSEVNARLNGAVTLTVFTILFLLYAVILRTATMQIKAIGTRLGSSEGHPPQRHHWSIAIFTAKLTDVLVFLTTKASAGSVHCFGPQPNRGVSCPRRELCTMDTNVTLSTQTFTSPSSSPYAFIAGHVALFFAIMTTNLLTLVAIATTPQLQTIPNMHIASLAVSDLLVSVTQATCIFWQHPDFYRYFAEGWFLCFFLKCMAFLSESSSITAITAIAVDRFVYIRFPFFYIRVVTKTRVKIAIILLWAYSAVTSVLIRSTRFQTKYSGCDAYAMAYDSEDNGRAMGASLLSIFVVLFVLYGVVIWTAVKQVKVIGVSHQLGVIRRSPTNVTASPEEPAGQAAVKARLKLKSVTRMAGVCIMMFVCWSPFLLIGLIGPKTVSPDGVIFVSAILAASNSVANFAVYGLSDREFRAAVTRLLRRLRSNRVSASTTEGNGHRAELESQTWREQRH